MDEVTRFPIAARDAGRSEGFSSAVRRLRRIGKMSLPELTCRSRQAASKWIDRARANGAFDANAILARQSRALASPDGALRLVGDKLPGRFFAGVANPAWVRAQVPSHAHEVVAAAPAAAQSRFDLLGYRALSFGNPIDWHFDPVWARRAPQVHWSRINPLDPDSVGDSKIVWELNRHQWVVRLAQAYAYTGEDRYAETALRAIDSWLAANAPGMGVNWSSSLEVAYRLMSWCWVLTLVRTSAALTDERARQVVAGIVLHARHVARYLSYYFSPNTHLTGEAMGLFYAGVLFPEMKDAARWRGVGARALVDQSAAQICSDGVHFERATCYHRYTAETYLQFLVLAARNGISVKPAVADRLRGLLEFLVAIRQPDGSLPLIGDSDGGQLLPLVERSPQDSRGVLALGAAFFERDDFAWAAEGPAPEVPWLMGEKGVAAFRRLNGARPAYSASKVFPSGGYAIMRSGWQRDAHQITVDAGPLGCGISDGHGHADLLSVQCATFGEPCLVDAGTYCYTPEGEWRNFFRGTAAHSTVMVDGRQQAEPLGPFSWRARPSARLREWRTSAEADFLDADHTAYQALPEPATHRRRVIYVKPDYWAIVDDITPAEGGVSAVRRAVHQIDVQFQFAPMRVSLLPGSWARADTPGGHALWVASFTSTQATMSVARGQVAPIRGWVSSQYGQRQPAPMLLISAYGTWPWRAITILMPRWDQRPTPPSVRSLHDDRGVPIGLQLEDRGQSLLIDDHNFLLTQI